MSLKNDKENIVNCKVVYEVKYHVESDPSQPIQRNERDSFPKAYILWGVLISEAIFIIVLLLNFFITYGLLECFK